MLDFLTLAVRPTLLLYYVATQDQGFPLVEMQMSNMCPTQAPWAKSDRQVIFFFFSFALFSFASAESQHESNKQPLSTLEWKHFPCRASFQNTLHHLPGLLRLTAQCWWIKRDYITFLYGYNGSLEDTALVSLQVTVFRSVAKKRHLMQNECDLQILKVFYYFF